MRRRALKIALFTVAILALVAVGFLVWVRSDDARRRFETVASEALNREVRVTRIDVGWDQLTLHGLSMSDPWSDAPALRIERGEFEVRWSSWVEGGVVGTLRAERFDLQVRKRGTETNLHGIRRRRSTKRPFDVVLELNGGEVKLHDEDRGESVLLEGVALAGRVQRADAQPIVELDARARAVRAHGIAASDVSVALAIDADGTQLEELEFRLGGGTVHGDARLSFDAVSAWSARVEAHDVGLQGELFPVLVAAFPGAAGVGSSPQDGIPGRFSVSAEVAASGLTQASVLQSLRGRLRVELEDVVLPREAAIVRIAALLGRPAEPLALDPLAIEASISGPSVRVESVHSAGVRLVLPFEGRVALDGRLDLQVDVLPLLRALPVAHDWAQRYTTALPIRLEGTTSEPRIRPPSAAAMARAVLGAWTG